MRDDSSCENNPESGLKEHFYYCSLLTNLLTSYFWRIETKHHQKKELVEFFPHFSEIHYINR